MGALSSVGSGVKTLGAAGVVFVGTLLAWPIVSGAMAGVLDMAGIVIPASTWLLASPLVAGAAAAYTAAEVAD